MTHSMKKLLLVFLIILVGVGILYYTRLYPQISITVNELYSPNKKVINVNDKYFQVSNGKVIDLDTGETIIGAAFAKVYDEKIWAYDTRLGFSLYCIDTSGNIINTYHLGNPINDFMIADNTLFTVSSEGINEYNIGDTLTEVPVDYTSLVKTEEYEILSFSSNDNMCVWLYAQSFSRYNSYYSVDLNSGECIIENGGFQIISANKDSVVFACLISYKYKSEILILDNNSGKVNTVEYDKFNSFNRTQSFVSKNKIYWIGQENTSRGFTKDTPPSACDEMKKHKHDVLLTIDRNSPESIDRWETKTFERILYVDDEVIVTYYNGKYIKYSTDSKKVISKTDTDVIKEPGSYLTQGCGDYVFVFDKESEKLLDKVSIK